MECLMKVESEQVVSCNECCTVCFCYTRSPPHTFFDRFSTLATNLPQAQFFVSRAGCVLCDPGTHTTIFLRLSHINSKQTTTMFRVASARKVAVLAVQQATMTPAAASSMSTAARAALQRHVPLVVRRGRRLCSTKPPASGGSSATSASSASTVVEGAAAASKSAAAAVKPKRSFAKTAGLATLALLGLSAGGLYIAGLVDEGMRRSQEFWMRGVCMCVCARLFWLQ